MSGCEDLLQPLSGPRVIRVGVVEDDPIIRAHLIDLIGAAPGLQVVGEAASVSASEAVISLRPDLLILDLGLPDGSGIDIIRRVRRDTALSGCRILVLTLFSDERRVLDALSSGADGYLLKDTEDELFVREIFATLAGAAPISSAAAAHLLRQVRHQAGSPAEPSPSPALALTPREIELLRVLAKGMSYKEAAGVMGISPNTVADYVKNIYRKMGVNSKGEAVFEAVASGVISL
jgi:DNA-binding NarL/FixJ family response regulator